MFHSTQEKGNSDNWQADHGPISLAFERKCRHCDTESPGNRCFHVQAEGTAPNQQGVGVASPPPDSYSGRSSRWFPRCLGRRVLSSWTERTSDYNLRRIRGGSERPCVPRPRMSIPVTPAGPAPGVDIPSRLSRSCGRRRSRLVTRGTWLPRGCAGRGPGRLSRSARLPKLLVSIWRVRSKGHGQRHYPADQRPSE